MDVEESPLRGLHSISLLLVFVCGQASGQVDCSPEYGPAQVIDQSTAGPLRVEAADLDLDGDPDALVYGFKAGFLRWFRNDGTGGFGASIPIDASNPGSVAIVDLDGDGDPDVVACNCVAMGPSFCTSTSTGWYPNLGGGTFGSFQFLATVPNDWLALHPADLDADGDTDLLWAAFGSDAVGWNENLGAGQLGPAKALTTSANGAARVDTADLDNDGLVDVVSASQLDSTIAWYRNLGGAFQPKSVVTSAASLVIDVRAADLDGDGDHDLVYGGDHMSGWIENGGGAQFGPPQLLGTAGNLSAVTDLDGDGRPDVLVEIPTSVDSAWYEHDGTGFGAPKVVPGWVRGTADVDGDSDLDTLACLPISGASFGVGWYPHDQLVCCQEDLGYQGPSGDVMLSVCGDDLTVAGSSALLIVSGATPGGSDVLVFAGLASNPVATPYGTLVPVPPAIILAATSTPQGTLSLQIPGGGGPPMTAYAQAAVVYSVFGVDVVKISNAVKIVLGT